jgi:outer membrane protein OmpA-like peptidoglycan-associated protein
MKLFLTLLLAGAYYTSSAQIIDVKESAKRKTENRVNNKTDDGIDKGLNKVEEGIGNLFKKKKKKTAQNEPAETSASGKDNTGSDSKGNTGNANSNPSATLKSYSKFDFVPGEKVLYYDDFENGETGDFPTGWNTNSTAELVRFNELPGKWLSITKDGYFQPEMISNMPDNFTLEFDVFNRYRSNNILAYNFIIGKSSNPRRDIGEDNSAEAAFNLTWAGCEGGFGYNVYENGEKMGFNDDLSSKNLVCGGEEYKEPASIRFSIWRQKNRLRVYLNEEKVLDIPQAFNSNLKYNVFKLGARYMNFANDREQDDQFMVTNFRYAVGAPDTRSKLITQGKFSTTGILFDVNSDKIKAGSFGTLKEIATVLKENPAVKVKIIGHTDSDGDDKANLALSQKRAAAVKQALTTEFGIDANRMQTDGKGEAEPAEPNTTAQGKANNRRVEFIKL